MPELPWVKWYPQLWLSETGLSLCSAATRGIWADALNHMLVSGSDSVTGTREQLAALCRCRPQEIEVAILELSEFKVAVVSTVGRADNGQFSQQNVSTTLACRRLRRLLHDRAMKRKAGLARAAQSQQDASRSRPARSPSPSTSSSSVQGEVQEREVQERPEAVIPTFDEIKEFAACNGVLFDSAKRFFDHHTDNNTWLNRFNRPINWKTKLITWATNDRERKHNGTYEKRGKPRTDANQGTTNDGRAHLYADIGRRDIKPVRAAGGSGTDSNEGGSRSLSP